MDFKDKKSEGSVCLKQLFSKGTSVILLYFKKDDIKYEQSKEEKAYMNQVRMKTTELLFRGQYSSRLRGV